jgi:hypothetical protein
VTTVAASIASMGFVGEQALHPLYRCHARL